MHEVSIAQSIAQSAMQHLAANSATCLTCISVEIGAFSGVVAQSLEFVWPAVAMNVLGYECEINIKIVSLKIKCNSCGHTQEADDIIQLCHNCQSTDVLVIEGMDMIITRLEMQ